MDICQGDRPAAHLNASQKLLSADQRRSKAALPDRPENGRKPQFQNFYAELAKRAGAEDFKHFYESVRQISAHNNDESQAFPEYPVLIEKKGKGRTLTEMVTFEPREYRRALATKAEPKPGYQTPYRGAGAFDISDDAYEEAKLYCRTHDLDFHTVYEGWKNSQFKKHMEFIIQHCRSPLKDPGKAFLGYLAKVVQNKFR